MLEINIDVTVTGNAKKYGFTLYNEQGEKVDFFFDTKKDKLWNEYGIANSGSFIMDRRYSGDHNFLLNGEKNWGTHGREKRLGGKDGIYAYTKNCYKYVDPFRLGTKIPMALLKNNKKHNVQIFYDKSHIEVFLDGGRGAMTNIVFPNGNYYNKLKFYTDKGTVNFEGTVYELTSTLAPNPTTSTDTNNDTEQNESEEGEQEETESTQQEETESPQQEETESANEGDENP